LIINDIAIITKSIPSYQYRQQFLECDNQNRPEIYNLNFFTKLNMWNLIFQYLKLIKTPIGEKQKYLY